MDETKTEKKKFFSKQNAKRFTSVLLVCALIIGSLLAFLTSTDSKTNVFTIGKVDIKLYEDDWYDHDTYKDTDTVEWLDDADDDGIPDFAENIVPNEEIDKAPYVTNDGLNDAWVYLVVAIPTAIEDDITQDDDGNVFLAGTEQYVKVTAYAVQTGYTDEETETAEGVWAQYVSNDSSLAMDALDYSSMFGEQETDTKTLADRYTLFRTLIGNDDDGYTEGVNTSEWTKLGDTYMAKADAKGNAYNYYVYKHNTTVAPDTSTGTLFDAVRLIAAFGETKANFAYWYVPETTATTSTGTAAAVDTANALAPEVPGYTLYAADMVASGETITLPLASEDICKLGSTIQWNTAKDGSGTEAYTGMTISEDTSFFINYESLASSEETNADYSWLKFRFENVSLNNAILMGADSTKECPTEPTTVVVPATISFTSTYIGCSKSTTQDGDIAYSYMYNIESDYTIYNLNSPAKYNGQTYNYSYTSRSATSVVPTGTVTVPVTQVSGFDATFASIAQNIVLPDTITTITGCRCSSSTPIFESINIPYNCVKLGSETTTTGPFVDDSNLTSVTIPNSVTLIGGGTFKNTGITSIVIPESVTTVGHALFQNCPLESIVWLSSIPMCNRLSASTFDNIPLQSADLSNLQFVYSNSSFWYPCINAKVPDTCKIILTENTKTVYTPSASCVSSSAINYMGSEADLDNVFTYNGVTTIGEYKAASPTSTLYDYNVNYTLTADDLAIINAA